MGEERLSDLSVLYIEFKHLKKLKSSLVMDDLINMFAEKKARKVYI